MYSLKDYGGMIADGVRMAAYEAAMRRVITPGSVVLDIGAGAGIMSLLAAKLGARRVVAVEPNPLVRVGSRLAVENGFASCITFVHGLSQQIELGEKFDVVVADLRGGLPNAACYIDAVVDARKRLMKPGGVLIPLRDTIFAAPVQVEEAFSKLVSPWRDNRFGLKMEGAVGAMLNRGLTGLKSIDRLLGRGQPIATLEYATVTSPNINVTTELQVEETGVVHGLSLWFETELVPGVGFSTAPDKEETVYGRWFLPMREPVDVTSGDRIEVSIKAALDDDTRLWIWRGKILAADGLKRASFASSSAFFNPESPDVREVFHSASKPSLSGDGRVVRDVMAGFDGKRCVADVVAAIITKHPDRFGHVEDAENFVRVVVERYGEATLNLED